MRVRVVARRETSPKLDVWELHTVETDDRHDEPTAVCGDVIPPVYAFPDDPGFTGLPSSADSLALLECDACARDGETDPVMVPRG